MMASPMNKVKNISIPTLGAVVEGKTIEFNPNNITQSFSKKKVKIHGLNLSQEINYNSSSKTLFYNTKTSDKKTSFRNPFDSQAQISPALNVNKSAKNTLQTVNSLISNSDIVGG